MPIRARRPRTKRRISLLPSEDGGLRRLQEEFMSAVSHELRTPLTAVLGFAHTLQRRADAMSPEEIREAADAIVRGADRLAGLVDELLTFDHVQHGAVRLHLRATSIDGLLRMLVAESDVWEHGPVFLDTVHVEAAVDAAKVEHLVEALLANVTCHTPEDTQVWVRLTEEDDTFTISVSDDGPGISETLRRSVFKPFHHGESSHPESPGAGVGLSLVAAYAEMHEGRAWVEERAGGGASFKVRLPKG